MSKEFRYMGTAKHGYSVGHKRPTNNLGDLGRVKRAEDGTWTARFTVPPHQVGPFVRQSCSWSRSGRRHGFRTRKEAATFLRDEKDVQRKVGREGWNDYREDRKAKGWMP